MTHSILHVGLGPLGRMILGDSLARRLGRVVAAVDVDPELVGRPLAELVDAAEGSLRVLSSLEQIEDWSAIDVAIVTTSSSLASCAPTLRELLRRGLPVVSTCEELLWPRLRHADLARELDRLARENGGRLLGTGVNPGFLMDALPVFSSAVCRSVRSVQAFRIQDASNRRLPFQRKIGAGLDLDAFRQRVAEGSLRHVGLGESLHFVAHALGFELESWDETIEAVIAERDLECGLGAIPRGHAAGVRQVAEGVASGAVRARLEFVAAIGQADPHDRVVIEGEPAIDLRLVGGVHGDVATSAIVLNAMRPLIAAPPGLHTMATIAMPSCSVASAPSRP